jgi:hypothetical protein
MKTTGLFLAATVGLFCAFAPRQQGASRQIVDPPASTYSRAKFDVTIAGKTASLDGARVSADFFRASRVLPLVGRLFLDEEYKSPTPSVAVLSYALWQERFESAPTAIGTKIQVDGQRVTIIGITPPRFRRADRRHALAAAIGPVAASRDESIARLNHIVAIISPCYGDNITISWL